MTVQYDDRTALDEVSCALEPGVTVLLGRNGAGKSTLCRVLASAEQPTRGRVLGPEGPVTDLRSHRARVGWLPQTPPVAAHMRAGDYLDYAAWLKGISRRDRPRAVAEALERTGLGARRGSRIGTLSGGMVRRLGIAQAIVHRPSLLVLDEPTVGLDPEQRVQFYATLRGALDADTVTLLSTHLLEDVGELAERVLVLDAGRMRFAGALETFLATVPASPDGDGRIRRAFMAQLTDEGAA
ncbi:ATP-binding cassette domain-containing protein [Nocardioides jishulii]|uniref:ATP-binding cassette domain-containing protein n=1 Tax=Nocardioides jishulii TaxID=2575440 RepID=UPI0014857175|nr:ATP-binding cassette domain-containing protein [Nocardioides jishulii]